MSEFKSKNPLIQDFLNEIVKKLPEWLKEKKAELKEILEELESHILDKADNLALEHPESNPEKNIQDAILLMGTPEKIAQEYKKRGTPYLYISKELFPYYRDTIAFFALFLFILVIIGNIFAFDMNNIGQFFLNLIMGTGLAILSVFFLSTLIWTGLSMEGFLPQDLGIKEKIYLDQDGHEKVQRIIVPKVQQSRKEPRNPIQPSEYIFEGIFGIIIGWLFISQPFMAFNNLFNPGFMFYLKIGGIFTVIAGVISLMRGFVSKSNIRGHQIFLGFLLIKEIIDVNLTWWLIQNPSWLIWTWWTFPLWLLQLLFVFSIIGLIDKIAKVFTLPQRVQKWQSN